MNPQHAQELVSPARSAAGGIGVGAQTCIGASGVRTSPQIQNKRRPPTPSARRCATRATLPANGRRVTDARRRCLRYALPSSPSPPTSLPARRLASARDGGDRRGALGKRQAIGVADRNTFAGVVRAHAEARERTIKFLPGTRLVTTDGFEVIAYPTNRDAYGRLCTSSLRRKASFRDQEIKANAISASTMFSASPKR